MIRRFTRPAYLVAVLLIYVLVSTVLGIALAPALWFLDRVQSRSAGLPSILRWLALGGGGAASFFILGFALLIVVPVYNWVLPTRVRPFKGGDYSLQAVPWFLHNGLFYLVRFTFLHFVTLSPFGIWFLQAMGMKIGRHAFINTEYISDPRLITLGDGPGPLGGDAGLPGRRGETWGGVPAVPISREEMERFKARIR